MSPNDLSLIKMQVSHYWLKQDKKEKVVHNGKIFYDGFVRVNSQLTAGVINDHLSKKITVAHSLILPGDKVENIVFDYNGYYPQKFYHRAQLLLREEGFINFTAYESTTPNHLHLYLHKGHTTLSEAYQIAKVLSGKLAQKMPVQWRMYPNADLPPQFNILTLPYEVYAKERGASWSRHM
ncbi:MAG: DUF1882 domain-containing protein [Helicobacteraceae bacterium]